MSNDIGLRVGAAGNQAAMIVAALAGISAVNTSEQAVDMHAKLTASLFNNMADLQDQIEGRNTQSVPVGPPAQDVGQVIQAEFGATPITQGEWDAGGYDSGPVVAQQPVAPQGGGSVEVVGDVHGPIPTWLPEAMAKDGCTKVYDNRNELQENSKRPWFKAADNTTFKTGKNAGKPVAYWPPRS